MEIQRDWRCPWRVTLVVKDEESAFTRTRGESVWAREEKMAGAVSG